MLLLCCLVLQSLLLRFASNSFVWHHRKLRGQPHFRFTAATVPSVNAFVCCLLIIVSAKSSSHISCLHKRASCFMCAVLSAVSEFALGGKLDGILNPGGTGTWGERNKRVRSTGVAVTALTTAFSPPFARQWSTQVSFLWLSAILWLLLLLQYILL